MKKILVYVLLVSLFVSLVSATNDNTAILSLSLVNQDPDPALAGEIVEIRIGVENKGGDSVENLVLELIPSYPFTKVSGEGLIKSVGTIGAYKYDADMKIVKFKLRVDRDATAGEYELKIKQYQEGSSEISIEKSFNIEIENRESAEVIYIDQVELIPGKITPMTFTVNNVGSAPLRELTFQWENSEDIILPVGSDNTKYIKYIDVGDDAEMEFNVIASANADPDLYKLDLKLIYNDPITGEPKEIATKAGVYVGGATDFDAAFSGSSNGESTFSISNIGSVSASSVTVRIPDQEGWKVMGSNSVIIGNLNEGDYTIASFALQQRGTTLPVQTDTSKDPSTQRTQPEDSKVKLEIIYTDSRGNRNTIKKEVEIDTSSLFAMSADGSVPTMGSRRSQMQQTDSSNNITWWIVSGIVVIVLFMIYRKHKKGKIKNSDYTYADTLKDVFAKFKKKSKK